VNIVHVKSARVRKNPDNTLKPPLVCELNEAHVITPGKPYKHVKAHMRAPQRVRCADCPSWKIWEISDSLAAQLQQVAHEFGEGLNDVTSADDVTELLETAANSVREIAEVKRESAQNMEDGFGHPTPQSEELEEQADELESWADEIETATVPDMPELEEEDCDACDGTGLTDTPDEPCDECNEGKVTPEELDDEQLGEWIGQCRDDLTIVDEPPF
jgi:rubrerythrin